MPDDAPNLPRARPRRRSSRRSRRCISASASAFPAPGLGGVCAELLQHCRGELGTGRDRSSRRNMPLRFGIFVLLAAGAVGARRGSSACSTRSRPSADNVYRVLQGVEAAANLIVLMGAGVFFLIAHRGAAEAARGAEGAARAALHRPRHRHAPAHQGPERGREHRRQARPRRRRARSPASR